MTTSPPAPQAASAPPRRTRWQALWFALRMIEIRLRFVLVLAGAALIVGYWDTLQNYWDLWTRPAVTVGTLESDSEFYCPMDPSVVREGLAPNGTVPKCPICGMPLSLRRKGQPLRLPPGVIGRVELSPDRVRLAGIRTVDLTIQPLAREVRAVGNVVYDESRRARIVTRVGGYLEKLLVSTTFAEVGEGDPLAEIYSPELYSAVQELLVAQRSSAQLLVETSREKLKLLGLDEREINSIVARGESGYRVVIRAPRAGTVIRKDVLVGERVETGQVLFEVADLSRVWIEADVFEKDIAALEVGQQVEATVGALPGRVFPGTVDVIYPELQASTRTNRVRFEVDNPTFELRAGMYATVSLTTPINQLEPFRTLLVASRLPEADPAAGIARQKVCPVTGAELGSMGQPVPAQVGDETIYLCCTGCMPSLETRPEHYLARLRTVTDDGVLAVPERAVVDTGDQTIVYVEREPGVYDGVEVQLGAKSNGSYPVIAGLLPGDRVAAAGAFLIDAETRLNPAAAAAYFGASGGPSRGEVDGVSGDVGAETRGRREPSESDLHNLSKLPSADRPRAVAQKWCPVTGLPLGSMGVPPKIEMADRTIFLCCAGCEALAREDSEKTRRTILEWEAERSPANDGIPSGR